MAPTIRDGLSCAATGPAANKANKANNAQHAAAAILLRVIVLSFMMRRPGGAANKFDACYSTPTKFRPSAAGAAVWRLHPHRMSTNSVSRYGVMVITNGETSAPAA